MSSDWGYAAFNGPATWAENYPDAGGVRQSPIDILTCDCQSDQELLGRQLVIQYDAVKSTKLINPGYGWKVAVEGETSELSGGPLDGIYKLEQFHCHWGCNNGEGSEHTVEGQSFAGELHLVHWNSSKYSSFNEAAAQPDGLAVLGVFLKEGEEHEEVEKIVSLLKKVSYKGETIEVGDIDPVQILPKSLGYWTYQGSLTTPPCTESVTWIVFKTPIEVSENQLKRFRKLRCCERTREEGESSDDEQTCIVTNYRPTLPLNSRVLRECGL